MTSAAAPPSVASAAPAASVRPSLRGPAIRRRGVPTLLAAAGGLALYLAFPSHDLSLLAVLGPAALSLVVYGRGLRAGGWLGFVFGLAYLTPLLSWTGVYVGAWPWLLLALWQAGYLALLGPALVLVQRLPLWPLWAACLWVADEALRSRWFLGGFPWGRLGVSQADSPFTAYAAYGGVPLLSVTVAL
ncbi:MAG: apolipoprotein N-acyltransferase, partial [Geodermatophilaceae bacterium]|nr:apolipoprotein N-acyltransferase [Geodermatophilaceae bacterium]